MWAPSLRVTVGTIVGQSGTRWHQSTLCFVTITQQQPSVWKCHVPFPHCAFHFTVCKFQISHGGFQPWRGLHETSLQIFLSVFCRLSSSFFKVILVSHDCVLLLLFHPHLVVDRAHCLVFTCVPFVCCQVTVLAACVSVLRLVVSSTSVNIVTDYYNNNVLISFSKSGGVPMQVQHHLLALLDSLLLLLFFFFWLPPSESTFQIVHFYNVPHICWIFSSLL